MDETCKICSKVIDTEDRSSFSILTEKGAESILCATSKREGKDHPASEIKEGDKVHIKCQFQVDFPREETKAQ